MKIKTDFITNSSSTSFVAWGIKRSFDDKINDWESVYDIAIKIGMIHTVDIEEEEYMLGLYPKHMQDNETLYQFKERISNNLSEAGIIVSPNEIDFFAEEIYE